MKFASTVAALLAGAALVSTSVQAQVPEDKWTFQAIVYGYFPDLGGTTNFPTRAGGGSANINVGIDSILSNLNFTMMGELEARKGRWGMFTDLIYLDVGGSKNDTRDFAVGGHAIPASVSANLTLDLKGTLWTLAGEYAAINEKSTILYVFGGARLLDMKQTLGYTLTADVGPITGPGRSGSTDVNLSYWDAIVGVKGKVAFGERDEWFVPYYADIGTGQSDLTYQLFGGIGYSFSWGSVLAGWRYLDYNFKSSSKVESLNFNGPMIGVAFGW
ncbi:MAG: hypothetical protein U1F54_05820 [Burkholderiales bacterium]